MVLLGIRTNTKGLPWWSSGKDSTLPIQGVQVQSLVRQLRSLMLHSQNQHQAKPVYWHRVCGEGTHRVCFRMPGKENRQRVLKRSELPSGFQGRVLKGNISVTWKIGFTSCWMSSQKTQRSQRSEEGGVYCSMQQIRRTLGILSKAVFLLNSIIGEVLS